MRSHKSVPMLNKHCPLLSLFLEKVSSNVGSVVFHGCYSWLNFLIFGYLVHWHCTFFNGMSVIYLNDFSGQRVR